jgi:hypothetical protein
MKWYHCYYHKWEYDDHGWKSKRMAQSSSSFCVCKPWYTKQSQLTTCIKATIKSYSLGDD